MDPTNQSSSAVDASPRPGQPSRLLRTLRASSPGRMVAWLGTPTQDEQTKRRTISACLMLLIAFMAIQCIPPKFFLVSALGGEPLVSKLSSKVTPYAVGIGLFQAWSMFSPNPKRENTYVDAEIMYRNGRKHIWVFPQMQELGYIERYAKERYRKFSNDRLVKKENSAIWPDATRYIARLNADASNPPQIVKLANYRCVIPTPPESGELPIPERWEREVFFVYNVQPEDLQ